MILKSRILMMVGGVIAGGGMLTDASVASGQQLRPVPASAQSQMKPLGTPSAVDRYRSPAPQIQRSSAIQIQRSPASQSNSRQWVETQSQVRPAQFTIPPSSEPMTSPPTGPSTPPTGPSPPTGLPNPTTGSPSLPMPPSLGPSSLGTSPQGAPLSVGGPSGDLTPLPQPRLGDVPFGGISAGPGSNGFATLNNSCQVSGPSGYSAALYSTNGGCAPVSYQAPLTTPGNLPPNPFAGQAPMGQTPFGQGSLPSGVPLGSAAAGGQSAPAGALLSFGQEAYPVQVGQGILGQPKAYVPGQSVRNWLRYLTP